MAEIDGRSLDALLSEFRRTLGDKELEKVLSRKLESTKKQKRVLTIVCDEGMHAIPDSIIVGEKYIFSEEPLNIESAETLSHDLEERVRKLSNFLRKRSWSRIRVVYAGHAILGSLVKHSVYRITHKETEDVVYFGSAGYFQIKLSIRTLLTDQQKENSD
jgi:hypothetical protein